MQYDRNFRYNFGAENPYKVHLDSFILATDTPSPSKNPITTIGNDVLISTKVFIKRGVVIGDGAVIGAQAVVVKDVPPYAVVVGNPGRIVKYRFPEHIIDRLLELRWWQYPIWQLSSLPFHDIERFIQTIEERKNCGDLQPYEPLVITERTLLHL